MRVCAWTAAHIVRNWRRESRADRPATVLLGVRARFRSHSGARKNSKRACSRATAPAPRRTFFQNYNADTIFAHLVPDAEYCARLTERKPQICITRVCINLMRCPKSPAQSISLSIGHLFTCPHYIAGGPSAGTRVAAPERSARLPTTDEIGTT